MSGVAATDRPRQRRRMTGYDEEVARCRADVQRLADEVRAEPADAARATALLYRRYHLTTLTGRVDDLPALRDELEQAIARTGPGGDLCMLLAQTDCTLHRFDDVPGDLARAPGLSRTRPARALLSDAQLHREPSPGVAERVRRELESLLDPPSWDVLSRLAGAHEACGDDEAADRAYAAAQDELSAKQMRAFAWLELRRGRLDLRRERLPEAAAHYDRAERAYPGYWLVAEHLADWLEHADRLDEALIRWRRVLAQAPRPTARERLAGCLERLGRTEEATAEYAAARRAYAASVAAGHVHYLHHLDDPASAWR